MPIPIMGTISGSSSASVLGLNKYQTPFEFWQNTLERMEPGFNSLKGYDLPEKFNGNASTRFGTAFEKSNIAITEEKLNIKITGQEKVFQEIYNRHIPLSSHVDGDYLYEGKTTTPFAYKAHWDEEKNIIPREYMCQIQHNMYMSKRDEAIVSVLIFPESPDKWEEMGWGTFLQKNGVYMLTKTEDDMESYTHPKRWASALSDMGFHKIYRIPRNDELIETMLGKYDEWWTKYIIGKTPPEPMNIDDIKRLCPAVSGTIVVDCSEIEDDDSDEIKKKKEAGNWFLNTFAEYKEIGKEIGDGGNMKKRRDQLKVLMLNAARSMPSVQDDDSTNKWIFRDNRGNKIGSWYKTAKGWVFR